MGSEKSEGVVLGEREGKLSSEGKGPLEAEGGHCSIITRGWGGLKHKRVCVRVCAVPFNFGRFCVLVFL